MEMEMKASTQKSEETITLIEVLNSTDSESDGDLDGETTEVFSSSSSVGDGFIECEDPKSNGKEIVADAMCSAANIKVEVISSSSSDGEGFINCILRCHELCVLDYRDVKTIPNQYIVQRWIKDFKSLHEDLAWTNDEPERKEQARFECTQYYAVESSLNGVLKDPLKKNKVKKKTTGDQLQIKKTRARKSKDSGKQSKNGQESRRFEHGSKDYETPPPKV
ncbi:hypothetical protein Sjap_023696 [Stephania japonica]|uniref:Protein FAR1-RELATED SEQUENCE n=1 Tax=Stephania japonica TaxID=461633 RepID=A0AAP0EKN8_9MAGN